MAASDVSVHANQTARVGSYAGIKVREDTAYADYKGQEQESIRERTEADIGKLQEVLSKILEPGEVIFYLLTARISAQDFDKLVLTNHRLLLFCVAHDSTWKKSISRGVHWGDVADAKVGGLAKRFLKLKYRDGTKETYGQIEAPSKQIKLLLDALLPSSKTEATPAEGLVRYCSSCFSALAPKAAHCARCGLATVSASAWDPNAISFISFFFSFLPAGIMHALNYERLGYPEKKKPRLILFIAGFVVFLAAAFTLRNAEILGAINIGIAIFFYADQGAIFQRHLAMGGKKASIVVPLVLSFLWFLILVGGVFAVDLLEPARDEESTFVFDLDKVIEELERQAELQPEDVDTHNLLASLYLQTGRHEDAVASYKRALTLDPDDADLRYGLGRAYQAMEAYNEAIGSFENALKLEPEKAEAHGALGSAFRATGAYEDSISSYQRAVSIEPDSARRHHDLAAGFMFNGEYEKAREECRAALQLDYAYAYSCMAISYFLERRFQKAREEYKKYFQATDFPGNYNVLWQHLILLHLGEDSTAEKHLARYAKGFERDEWGLSLLHYYQGKLAQAELLSRTRDKKKRCEAYFYVGYQYLLQGNKQEARKYFRKALDTKVFNFYEYIMARARLEQSRTN